MSNMPKINLENMKQEVVKSEPTTPKTRRAKRRHNRQLRAKNQKKRNVHGTWGGPICISDSDEDEVALLLEDQNQSESINVSDSDDESIPEKRIKIESPLLIVSDEDILISNQPGTSVKQELKTLANVKKENRQEMKTQSTLKTERIDFQEPPNDMDDIKVTWCDYELLAQRKDLKLNIAKNLINLFQEGNTVPFIARYRRDATENMSPDTLREVRDCYEDICHFKQKVSSVIKTLDRSGHLNPQLEKSVVCARSFDELEIIYAPFKPGTKRSLAERAKDLGLEQPAIDILNNSSPGEFGKYVNPSKDELNTVDKVHKGIIHIMAQKMATDSDTLTFMRQLRTEANIMLESKKSKRKTETKPKAKLGKTPNESKFEHYFDYKVPIKYVKPHQILAINRGEHHKILSVKTVVPDYLEHRFIKFTLSKWQNDEQNDLQRTVILKSAAKDAYSRLVQPLIMREVRSELKTLAEKASYEVFSKNLKHLLLAPPLKGQHILAIDPGFTGGCKLALVSQTGSLLDYNVIYPHQNSEQRTAAANILDKMLKMNNCCLIALGNGTACRETEEWLTELIQRKYFAPRDVQYTIVCEDGASIYSCSPEAKKEFPTLDTNIISSVSLARRIQDPLSELVKIDPQHLGVGMYQHDLKKKTLEEALSDVVSECVSFVGVDLNTTSQCLLRRIAGLTAKRATQIIEYREKNGPYSYRKEITNVFGIGQKVFQQCAGFLRVGPPTAEEANDFYRKPNTTKLDCTDIHPESYDLATKIIKTFKLKVEDIGDSNFINFFKVLKVDPAKFSKELDSTEETIKQILDALSKPLNYDMRTTILKVPLFKKGLTSINDLKTGTIVKGQVRNVTHFGCFVDIGVGSDALIHNSKLKGLTLQIGDRVEAKVLNVEIARNRISLEATSKI